MKALTNHVLLMLFYACEIGLFFTLLWKEGKQERLRFFLLVFCSLFFGGIALSWVMYPFPLR